MSPRQFATLIVVLSVPLFLWIAINEAKNDVKALTKTLANQIKMNGDSLFEPFFAKYRLPDGDPSEQETMLQGAYLALAEVETEKATYGVRDRIRLGDGHDHNHRQVVLVGRNSEGAPLTVKIEWVQLQGKWFIHAYTRD